MNYVFKDTGKGYAAIELSGDVNNSDRIRIIKEIYAECRKLGIQRILIDLNQATARTTHLEDFNFGTFLSDHMRDFKIASFSAELGRVDFINRVTRARRLNANRFQTKEEAISWLIDG